MRWAACLSTAVVCGARPGVMGKLRVSDATPNVMKGTRVPIAEQFHQRARTLNLPVRINPGKKCFEGTWILP